MKVNLNVSGFETQAEFPNSDVEQIHKPLVEKFSKLYKEKQDRVIIFLAAPPGSGKSTLAAFWEHLSEQDEALETLQVLPFDGFHFPNEILDSNSTTRNGKEVLLRSIKGAYETFNLTELVRKLRQLKDPAPKWPYYDRNLHDPVDDALIVDKNIVVIEGNYLLLDQPVWNGLKNFADFTVFIDTDPQFLQARLVNRKIRGGTSEEDALDFYYKSDAINVDNVLNNSQKADLNLYLNQDGSFKI
ncbi:nucleoside/nucleotide kinase family protein [Vibrio sp. McD22-P3]|uniref:nucleoside/nucleotide kinase family protein n=1 Tax=Vibrio sp. McD22-P3 TaxID=2724880 RepID=UPI001F3207BE|nr:nucleoside/nucleotide kinase family protein [Vibrio sp. McD22-P3]MCF4172726.1 nucleoside/nucleotide kinase family protein [Vibrio sp. McD22-P3]